MISRKAEGKEGRTFIGDLTEEKSVEMASKIASESFVFGVSCEHDTTVCMTANPIVQPSKACAWLLCYYDNIICLQVATLLIFLEYDRNRRNEIKKKRKEAAEKSSIIEQARQEREVRSMAAEAFKHNLSTWLAQLPYALYSSIECFTSVFASVWVLQQLFCMNQLSIVASLTIPVHTALVATASQGLCMACTES